MYGAEYLGEHIHGAMVGDRVRSYKEAKKSGVSANNVHDARPGLFVTEHRRRVERVEIPAASHAVQEDNPAAYNDAVLSFLVSLRGHQTATG